MEQGRKHPETGEGTAWCCPKGQKVCYAMKPCCGTDRGKSVKAQPVRVYYSTEFNYTTLLT
jgi:hypothetical protein